jgi:integrase
MHGAWRGQGESTFERGFPTSKPRDRYVTDDGFLAVRDCAPPMVRYAMNISLITGARQKDILRLDRKQVAAGVLHVRQSKTGKKVDYPVAGSLEENIDAALKMSPQVRQFVIVSRKGKPCTRDGFQTQWKRASAPGTRTPRSRRKSTGGSPKSLP